MGGVGGVGNSGVGRGSGIFKLVDVDVFDFLENVFKVSVVIFDVFVVFGIVSFGSVRVFVINVLGVISSIIVEVDVEDYVYIFEGIFDIVVFGSKSEVRGFLI